MSEQRLRAATSTRPRKRPFSIGIPAAHAALRSTPSWIVLNLAGVVFVALLRIPAFAHTTGVSFAKGAPATGLVVLAVGVATLTYRATGLSRAYYVADLVEGLITEGFCAFLIVSSRNVVHFVWLFYIFHVVLTAGVGITVRNFLVVVSGPAAVAALFAMGGNPGPALVGALGGVIGISFYLVVGRTYDDLESTRQREGELRNSLAQLQVTQERVRIARDLHDGVAAELSALVWRARVLAHDGQSATAPGELLAFEKRVLTALDQLRDVVLGLRGAPAGWTSATALLADRCRELCRDTELDFITDGEMDTAAQSPVWVAVQPIVLELVRNAIRHARGRRVEVRLRANGGLQLEVNDDGRGMVPSDWKESRGGLANVAARVGDLLGKMTVESSANGTRIAIRLPFARKPSLTRDPGITAEHPIPSRTPGLSTPLDRR